MLAERLDGERAKLPFLPLHLDGLVLVEVELFGLVIELRPERDLPVRRDPIRPHGRAELRLPAGFFSFERRGALQAEDPVVPPVAGHGRAFVLAPEPDRHAEPLRHAAARDVIQQADPQRRRELPPDDIFLIRLGRDRLERVVDPLVAAGADEGGCVFAPAPSGFGARDQDVHVRFAAVADVVHEGHLRSEEIREAVAAVEEDADLRRQGLRVQHRPGRGQGGTGQGDENGCRGNAGRRQRRNGHAEGYQKPAA